MSGLARLATLLVVLTGCAGRPVDPEQVARPDELRPGVGAFSGADGAFTYGIGTGEP